MPDDASWTDPVVVPDDLRSLQADIDAYHRELRRHQLRRRHPWIAAMAHRAQGRRLLLPVAVLMAGLAVGSLVVALIAGGTARPAPLRSAPLAPHPAAAPGAVDGLLPDVTVRSTADERTAIRDLRPALVALVPMSCGCAAVLGQLASQAFEVRMRLLAVAPAARDAEVAALSGRVHRGEVVPLFDDSGALATAYAATGLTVLVVRADGTVGYIGRDVVSGVRLELPLQKAVFQP